MGDALAFGHFLHGIAEHFHVGIDELRLHLDAVQREAGTVFHAANLSLLLHYLTLQLLQRFRLMHSTHHTFAAMERMFGFLVLNSTFSTNWLYNAIGI